jgi:hypothetical protein
MTLLAVGLLAGLVGLVWVGQGIGFPISKQQLHDQSETMGLPRGSLSHLGPRRSCHFTADLTANLWLTTSCVHCLKINRVPASVGNETGCKRGLRDAGTTRGPPFHVLKIEQVDQVIRVFKGQAGLRQSVHLGLASR